MSIERSGNEQQLEPEQRHEHEAGEASPDDRAERIDAVHLADRALAAHTPAVVHEHLRDERQRHAGAEGGRHHDERGRSHSDAMRNARYPALLCVNCRA